MDLESAININISLLNNNKQQQLKTINSKKHFKKTLNKIKQRQGT